MRDLWAVAFPVFQGRCSRLPSLSDDSQAPIVSPMPEFPGDRRKKTMFQSVRTITVFCGCAELIKRTVQGQRCCLVMENRQSVNISFDPLFFFQGCFFICHESSPFDQIQPCGSFHPSVPTKQSRRSAPDSLFFRRTDIS